MITEKYIRENLARAEMAESVEIPANKWVEILTDLCELRKLALDVQTFFELKDVTLSAEGKSNLLIRNLMSDAANFAHSIRYEDVK